jgi:N-acetylmuramoyl-L-alanine amidase CwlA
MDRHELGRLLNLKVEMIPEGKPNRSGRRINLKNITVHNTSNDRPGADAAAHSRFVREKGFYILSSGKKNFVSWHYTVDDKMVIKHLPISERAIHAGSGNATSVAIEVCMHQGIDQQTADLRAARLIAALMHDLKLDRTSVKSHKHWTGKNCPILLLPAFERFVDQADEICRSIDAPESVLVADDERQAIAEASTRAAEGATEELEPEADPDDEHALVAAEVAKFIEQK